jgi:ribosome maturation factor RimP
VPTFCFSCKVRLVTNKESKLAALLQPLVETMGYQLWGLEYISQGRHSLLRIYLDKKGGVNIEDCTEVSRQLSSLLDVEDPISGEYILEVSSPGLERVLFNLQQFREYTSYQVKVRLARSFEGKRNFTGQIKNVVDDEVVLIMGDEELTLPYELIEKANLVSQM